jgi:predicted transcriptional regulator
MKSESWALADTWTAAAEQVHRPGTSGGWAASEVPIRHVMTSDPICLEPAWSLEAARRALHEGGVTRAPVVNQQGRPVGILCMSDLPNGTSAHAAVDDVMTPFVFSLPENAGVGRAAALMAYEDVQQLVVTGQDGAVVGLVSALDVASWFARRMGYLRAANRLTWARSS